MELSEVWSKINSIIQHEQFVSSSLDEEKLNAKKENENVASELNGLIAALEENDFLGKIERGELLDPIYGKEIIEGQDRLNTLVNSSNYLLTELFNSYRNASSQLIQSHEKALENLLD
ncbi:hypothetical protein TVAG_379490 [Trichomonas vaginalis G3]|uniref:Uncharacterized protein n=1 Tax=Trichomonas vaginalis (strain ATCC PRA-98 / G3) TaxID=412133 RepID=A2E7H4_TRIV3|nr:hypothetical protein TVAGG3_0339560 [Trichomonas vaginalis G3]EAY11367.1 hypothetical protein TVAG_379490 [Trichomonas vaginalis G3]KAI5530532.1 hypothetical protein TVAGG3_0339560 [Trichomonas vaginalis G3]|eukprot:XP_001323590.1 hypothetical protein [Trichomonas vaginalis G3]